MRRRSGPAAAAAPRLSILSVADGDARPVWNKGDYFGTLYKGPMADKAVRK